MKNKETDDIIIKYFENKYKGYSVEFVQSHNNRSDGITTSFVADNKILLYHTGYYGGKSNVYSYKNIIRLYSIKNIL